MRNWMLVSTLVSAAFLRPGWAQDPSAPPAAAPADVAIPTISLEQYFQQAAALKQEAERARAAGDQRGMAVAYARAVETLTKILAQDQTNVQANLEIGDILAAQNDWNNARNYYRRVLTVENANFRANLGMGNYYVVTRFYRQALFYLQEANKAAPADRKGEVLQLLARTYRESGYLNDALETVKQALQADPTNEDAAGDYIVTLLQMQQYQQAVGAADALLQIMRQKSLQRAFDAQVVGKYVAAFDAKISALQALHNSYHKRNSRNEVTDEPLEGREKDIANVLTMIVQTRAEQLPVVSTYKLLELVPLAQRSTALEPNVAGHWLVLARVCADAGLYGDALSALQTCVRLEPQNTTYQSLLQQLENRIAQIRASRDAGAAQSQNQGQGQAPAPPPPGQPPLNP